MNLRSKESFQFSEGPFGLKSFRGDFEVCRQRQSQVRDLEMVGTVVFNWKFVSAWWSRNVQGPLKTFSSLACGVLCQLYMYLDK